MLAYQHIKTLISIAIDASNSATGVYLTQSVNRTWESLIFFSRRLPDNELKSSPFCREGQEFTQFSDHESLTFSMCSSSDKHSTTSTIQLISGASNVVADALSRITFLNSSQEVYPPKLVQLQKEKNWSSHTKRGRQFESEIFRCFTITLGIKRFRATAYHQEANMLIERAGLQRCVFRAVCFHSTTVNRCFS